MKFNPELAGQLPNGATILKRKKLKEHWVWMGYRVGGAMPYAIWLSNLNSPGETYWGDYCTTALEAVGAFEKKVINYS